MAALLDNLDLVARRDTKRLMVECGVDAADIADMIAEVLLDIKNVETAHKVRARVRDLTAKFPLPY